MRFGRRGAADIVGHDQEVDGSSSGTEELHCRFASKNPKKDTLKIFYKNGLNDNAGPSSSGHTKIVDLT